MNITRSYKVAGHIFNLCFPDIDKLWNAFEAQYKPFETQNPKDSEAIFTLTLDENLPQADRQCVYDAHTEEGETVVKLFKGTDDWIFETYVDKNHPLCATIWSSADFRECRINLATRLVRDATFGINNAAMLMFAFSTAKFNTLEMHSSVIENGGRAYLFLGKSGTGKSTHSSLWLKHIEGSTLMNDDNPAVRIWPDGRIIAYGTPWSGKTPCYKNIEAPVGAFVQLEQRPENKIERMSVLESYSSLFGSISGMKEDGVMSDFLDDSMSKIISNIPCYRLGCLPDEGAARLCASTVRG